MTLTASRPERLEVAIHEPAHARPLGRVETRQLLEEVRRSCQARVVAFDLDSTLLDIDQHITAHELATDHSGRAVALLDGIASIRDFDTSAG